MADKKPTIRVIENGPLTVTGLKRFENSRGEPIVSSSPMALCRCGVSKNKPMCDGSHVGMGFSDERNEAQVPDKRDSYVGRGSPEREAAIRIARNGPYLVEGGIELLGASLGQGAPLEHYTLCRCGQSRNKPRCDGSHWYAAFTDDEALTISAANRALAEKAPEWQKVAEVDEMSPGQTKSLVLMDQQIVLSRLGDRYGAVEGVCPHQGGPLGDGSIDGEVLRCPWHGHPFDPITGKALGDDADLKAFETEQRSDGIYLKVDAPAKSAWTVSHVLAETMVNWGVQVVFGMVGHSNLGLAEALRVQEGKGKLRYIGIRHEGAAAFACSGYAKVTGRPAACLTIAGPGATNLITGLWDAKMDQAPVLALTGQISTQFLGPGAFQEIDLVSAFDAVAGFSKVVLPNSDHAELMSLALKSASVQRNVAHLIVPDEVQVQDAGQAGPGQAEGRVSDTQITPSANSMALAMSRLARAQRPAIIVGYGARDAMEPIITLADRLNAPVLTTFKAKGQISDHHPLACGVLGRSGTPVSSWFMNNSDLLLVFGASFSQHTGIDHHKPLIQVDYDRMALGKFHAVDTPIWGEIAISAGIFLEQLSDKLECLNCRAEIAERWRLWRLEKERRAAMESEKGLNSALIMETLSQVSPPNALFSLDVGNNTYSFGRYFECREQRVILCGYLGSIGFGFPAAMGAFMAQTGRPIVSVSGDGGFAQYMGEFNTAVQHKMNITHVLINNGELGKISKEQRDGKWPVWNTDLSNPNFADYAKACGGMGIRVDRAQDLEDALSQALAYDGPALVDVVSDPDLT